MRLIPYLFRHAALTAAPLIAILFASGGAAASEYNFVMPLSTSRVLIGGTFTKGGAAGWKNMMILDTQGHTPSGVTKLRFNGPVRGAVKSFNYIYVWGGFSTVNGQPRKGLAKIAMNGQLQSWAPAINGGTVSGVLSTTSGIAAATHILVYGNLRADRNGTEINPYLIKLKQSDGSLEPSFAMVDFGTYSVSNISAVRNGNKVWMMSSRMHGVGATKRWMGTTPHEYDVATGARTNLSISHPKQVLGLELSGTRLYMLGNDTKSLRPQMRAFSLPNRTELWKTNITTPSSTPNRFTAYGFKKNGNKLWVWGRSGFVGPATPYSLTSINTSDGAQNGWQSNWGGNKCLPVQHINFIRFNGSKAFMATKTDLRRCHSSTWVRSPNFFGGQAF